MDIWKKPTLTKENINDKVINNFNIDKVLTRRYEKSGNLALEIKDVFGKSIAVITQELDTIYDLGKEECFINSCDFSWAIQFLNKNNLGAYEDYEEIYNGKNYSLYKINLKGIKIFNEKK